MMKSKEFKTSHLVSLLPCSLPHCTLSLVFVIIKSKELKTKISLTHSLILSHGFSNSLSPSYCCYTAQWVLLGACTVGVDLCRCRFFGGKLVIEGEEMDSTLFKMVKDTMKATDGMIGQGVEHLMSIS